MKVSADRDRCIGAGHCAITAPGVFDNGDDGLVVVLTPEPEDGDRQAVDRAERLCPSRAISLTSTTGGRP
ncbi:ferredoxin [Actinomadura sp. 9N215]|uniref:ferredoxin n=1 Tax=Actinomadura sp. 9N215 TaxID=3375150 RepID=UPI00378C96F6